MVIFSNLIRTGDAQIAQSVEQRTENPRVDGSIPSLGTIPALLFILKIYLLLAYAMFSHCFYDFII